MMITLERFAYLYEGTFGHFTINDEDFYTVECPWANNEKFVSCLPESIYDLEPHESKKYGSVYALVNNELGITHYKEANSTRYACLMHVANWPKDVKGCIGIGKSIDIIDNKMQILDSRAALNIAAHLIEDLVITRIEITHAEAKL